MDNTHGYVNESTTELPGVLLPGHSEMWSGSATFTPENTYDSFASYGHPEGFLMDPSRRNNEFPFPNDYSGFPWPDTQDPHPRDANPD